MSHFLNLAENPLFVKHVRSRLRHASLTPSLIIMGFFCICIIWADRTFWKAEGIGSHVFFWLQLMILMLMGGSQVATSVASVKESGILDFHRVTPVSSSRQVLGFLLGAPIREWLFFAFTIPFALICAVMGSWGIGNFTKLLVVQITGALFYHAMAVVTGLAGKAAKGASGRLVALVIALNVISAQFNANGANGPAMLSPLPVYMEVTNDTLLNRGGFNPRAARLDPDAKFFGVPVALVFQTLLCQASIFIFLFIAASRRFRSGRLPLFSKPQAFFFMALLSFLTLGLLWESSGLTLILSISYFLTFSAVWLMSTVTVPIGEFNKGLQRAHKKGRSRIPTWSDLASNKLVVLTLALLLLGATLLVMFFAPMPRVNFRFSPWPPLILGMLTILSYGWAGQYFNLKYGKRGQLFFGLYIFFVWVAPVMVGGLLMASGLREAGYLMASSPPLGIFFASTADLPPLMQAEVAQAIAIAPTALLAVLFGFLLIKREGQLIRAVDEEHRGRKEELAAE